LDVIASFLVQQSSEKMDDALAPRSSQKWAYLDDNPALSDAPTSVGSQSSNAKRLKADTASAAKVDEAKAKAGLALQGPSVFAFVFIGAPKS
jgi:hypothetical protein